MPAAETLKLLEDQLDASYVRPAAQSYSPIFCECLVTANWRRKECGFRKRVPAVRQQMTST
jgi:hypothetical protein